MSDSYIRVYDNVIETSLCKELIEHFENNPKQQENVVVEDQMSFKQITLQHHDNWKKYCDKLQKVFFSYIETYSKDCDLLSYKVFPEKFAFEMFRMKRYLPNNKDMFDYHVDVGDYQSARRFLVFFVYLSDNEHGHTYFPNYRMSVQPVTGKLLMFPPLWTHVHTGIKPIKEPKYIIGSYLHYV